MRCTPLLLAAVFAHAASAADTPMAPVKDSGWAPIVRGLTQAERAEMTGVSWQEGCPVELDDLRVLELDHHTDGGARARGELIVHAHVASDVVQAFHALYESGFPLTSMRPVRAFGGSDDASMAADNTSAFNCRAVSGGRSWSQHAYGTAIDINPLRNPYVRGDRVDPPEGRAWIARDAPRPGMIRAGDTAVQAFRAIGWGWGGTWRSAKDYQHFSKSGT